MIRGEFIDLKVVAIGVVVMLAQSILAIGLVGLSDAVPAILVAGVVSGAVTGWLSNDTTSVRATLQRGGFLGLYAAGLGGIVIFVIFLVTDVSTMAQSGNILLFFVASPVAFVLFALEGLLGGYLGSGLRVLSRRLGPNK